MPVTAKLSKLFYERVGDQVANELVDWFNAVDETYRSDLRELNELNFARFDAKLEQRMAEMNAKLEQRMAEMNAKLEQRMAEMNAKIDRGLAELRADLSIKIAELEAKMERRFGDMERRLGEQTRWLFITWVTLVLGIAGLWFRH
jgi:DNA anti-recombination protein RmuC